MKRIVLLFAASVLLGVNTYAQQEEFSTKEKVAVAIKEVEKFVTFTEEQKMKLQELGESFVTKYQSIREGDEESFSKLKKERNDEVSNLLTKEQIELLKQNQELLRKAMREKGILFW